MPDIHGFSYVTTGTVPASSWDVAWDTLQSWKGLMQSFPGFQALRIEARRLADGSVRLYTNTQFETVAELEEWARSPYTAEVALTGLPEAVQNLQSEAFEVLT